ncbi:MAG: class I SAM-dependent methyltransferase [Candidatus Bathyarchaeota archaeon]|nr:class I SAM-dependent methyltransferase [Candidatus Bathyarchaeota archaeon]
MDQFRRPTGRRGRLVAALMNKGHEMLALWGLTHVNIKSDHLILDVGCGGGQTINRLAQRASLGKVFGVDYSADMVEYARKVNKQLITENRVEIIAGSVEKMGFSDNFFDLVTAIETYYFWSSFSDALKEIRRVLKPSGKLMIINEMVKDGLYDVKHAKMIEQTHVRLIPLEEIRDIVQTVGFVEVQIFTKTDSPWNAILAKNSKMLPNRMAC